MIIFFFKLDLVQTNICFYLLNSVHHRAKKFFFYKEGGIVVLSVNTHVLVYAQVKSWFTDEIICFNWS